MEQYLARQSDILDGKKEEISQLIEKNGRIITQTESNLAKIELYVRRLQRYYDENGIGLNILPVFGLETKIIS